MDGVEGLGLSLGSQQLGSGYASFSSELWVCDGSFAEVGVHDELVIALVRDRCILKPCQVSSRSRASCLGAPALAHGKGNPLAAEGALLVCSEQSCMRFAHQLAWRYTCRTVLVAARSCRDEPRVATRTVEVLSGRSVNGGGLGLSCGVCSQVSVARSLAGRPAGSVMGESCVGASRLTGCHGWRQPPAMGPRCMRLHRKSPSAPPPVKSRERW